MIKSFRKSESIPLQSIRMKTRVLFLLIILVGSMNMSAQNLVPNGGFEDYEECPSSLDGIQLFCSDWYKSIQEPGETMSNNPSPDYFHICSENEILSPPSTIAGFQSAFEGEAFAGAISVSASNSEYREILGVELIENLVIGENYLISFRVVRSNSENESLASNGIGLKFSTTPIYTSTEACVNDEASFIVTEVISDTLNWVEYDTIFEADSAYTHVHLGCFFRENLLSIEESESGFNDAAYYFFDDIRVSQSLTDQFEYQVNTSEVIVYPNPSTDKVFIEVNKTYPDVLSRIELFTCTGLLVLSTASNSAAETIDISEFARGLYFLQFTFAKGKIIRRKIKKY